MKKFITKMLQGAAVALSLVSFASCGSKEDPTVAVTGVSLNKTAVELTEGATATLEATVSEQRDGEGRHLVLRQRVRRDGLQRHGHGREGRQRDRHRHHQDGGKTAQCAVTVKPKVIEA